jgi:hypothetical protein
MQYGSAPS